MKKTNKIFILVMGILLFILSYKFDERIDLFFKDIKFELLDIILGIITNFGVAVLVLSVIPSIILYKKNKRLVYLIWLTFIVSFILAFVIKLLFLRQRPIEAFTYPFTSIINYSFPSMHSMIVFSLLPLLNKHTPKNKIFWCVFAILVSFSRIYFSFHFLSDVVFGALFGYFVGDYLLKLYEERKLWK